MTCICGHCNTPLRSRPQTSNDGGLIEVVDPCSRCRLRISDRPKAAEPEPAVAPAQRSRRLGNRHQPRIEGDQALCITCGTIITRWIRGVTQGRVPVFCEPGRCGKVQ